MSTTNDTTDSDSLENPTLDEVSHEELEEQILDELPERYQPLSHIWEGNGGDIHMILIPSHPRIGKDGKPSSHILMSSERRTVEDFGFTFKFITMNSKGAGVKVWFEYDE
jgi:hypothetical protein